MKKKLILTAVSICLFNLFSVKSFSQSISKGFIGSIGGGVSIPAGDFQDNNETGFEIGLKGGYKFNNNFISGIDVNYDYFSHKDSDTSVISGFNTNVISISAFLMVGNFKKNVKLNPYFLLGAGLYLRNSTSATTTYGTFEATGYKSYFGMDIGAGLSYRVSNSASIFIEPKYSGTFESPNTIFLSVKAGVVVGL